MRQVAKKGLLTMVATGGVLAATGGAMAYADTGAAGAAVGSPGVLSGNNVQVPVHVPVNACGNTVDVVGLLNPAFGNNCANVSSGGGAGHSGVGGGTAGSGSHKSGSGAGSSGSHAGGDTTGSGSHAGGDTTGRGPQAGGDTTGSDSPGGAGTAGSGAHGAAVGSPGVGSGNLAQVPVHVPVNACGLGVNVVGVLNPVFGNECANQSGPAPQTPDTPGTPQTPGTPGTPGTPAVPVSHPQTPVATPGVSHTVPDTARVTLAHTGADGMGFAASAAGALLLGGAVLYRRGRTTAKR